VIVNEPETAMIVEANNLSEDTTSPETVSAMNDTLPTETEVSTNIMHGKTSTRVNIRDAASQDARVLNTVDQGTTFDILEILNNGWTKILYEGSEAYISSDYVIITTE
jgi:SH3 domain protein